MYAKKGNYQPEEYHIPTDLLESISDFFFRSNSENEEYTCWIACKYYGMKKIKILDIKDLDNYEIIESE
jgi:hypothetical protein